MKSKSTITHFCEWALFFIGFILFAAPPAVAQSCAPYSTLPCNQLQAALPVNLTFSGNVSGTMVDKNGIGTGFRMVVPYSGSRLSADGKPSNKKIKAYESGRLSVSSGTLKVTSNKGIAYITNNNQLNTLGVQVDSRKKLQLGLLILKPYNGSAGQQGGIWFGLNDKTFLKLVVTGNKVELRKETNDVSGTADQRITSTISGLDNQNVRLRLEIDLATNTAEGFYSVDGTTYVNVGAAYTTKGLNITGMGLTASTAYACLYATHRNATQAVTYTFDELSVKEVASSPRPYVTAVRPADGATNVPLDQSVAVDLAFPSGKSIDGATVNTSTVKLFRVTSTGLSQVSGTAVNTTAAGDAITLSATLAVSTTYEFQITDQVKDLNGYAMIPFASRFTTTSSSEGTPPDLEGYPLPYRRW
ncbi:Ig-like domain-containing protein [Pontibacter sp. E15-1]|uniref:Ig-like domain-containing protein n=1 Tax=Pontibacter sp. E15-1 TaxID=2919918 RepID=UPI001F4F8EE2|nr:Ig-like domain-containing protein [Pontibacter sp. E15-1]MCJ8164236.1 Ig-like domain-containing protein [Pontibacter sp. E15-1]